MYWGLMRVEKGGGATSSERREERDVRQGLPQLLGQDNIAAARMGRVGQGMG